MQKFKTMAKLKLKTVQNGTEGEMANLMDSGSYSYVNDQGYIIVGSGVLDNSGNIVEKGWIEIESGYEVYHLGYNPTLEIEFSWDSGIFTLPISTSYGSDGYAPCVNCAYSDPVVVNSIYPVGQILSVRDFGLSPLCRRLTIEYTVLHGFTFIRESDFKDLYIPFVFHKTDGES